jgi:hypothetical protein
MGVTVSELAPGLWRWAARHPDWHPGTFGSEVASYAMRVRGGALLVDPLLPAQGGEELEALLDELLAPPGAVHVYITIPYHVRSTADIARRAGRRARVWGERRAARRLDARVRDPLDQELPFGGRAFAIGRPRRAERPLWIEDHAALAFGDALVARPGGELRVWSQDKLDARRLAFYRERFTPTLAPLLELPCERVLVTHGAAVASGGAAALARAVAAEPWYHHG